MSKQLIGGRGMAKRWRKSPRPTGLARIYAGPQGSELWDGDLKLASVNYRDGRFDTPVGWYWVGLSNSDLGVVHKNTCNEPVDSEKEAKAQAKAYIEDCLKVVKQIKD